MVKNAMDIAVFYVLWRQAEACTLKSSYTGFVSLRKLEVLILIFNEM